MISYAKQFIDESDVKAVVAALKGDAITRGAQVTAFEEKLAASCDATFAVAFSSGTAALEAAAFAAETCAHDRLITTPNTFVGSVAGFVKRGASLKLIDIEMPTANMNQEILLKEINQPKTRGKEIILAVHFAGVAIDMEKVSVAITEPDTVLIEDAAHALGSCYPSGKKVGSCAYSDMTIFSFHPAKQITTGEGGAVLTNDPKYHERLKLFRNNGIVPTADGLCYDVVALTGNTNFTEFQAALGLSQLKKLDSFVEKRRKLVRHYRLSLQGRIPCLPEEYDARTSYHLFVVQLEERDRMRQKLQEAGISTQVHYPPLYRLSALSVTGEFPEMENYFAKALTLPLHYGMTEADVERVVSHLL